MMMERSAPLVILMADDDADDRLLASEALEESKLAYSLEFVTDGVELLEYLTSKGDYEAKPKPLPGIILLDLNMPRMDGLEVLKKIKKDRRLRLIPVVVLTTSSAEEDLIRSYSLGAASFLTKPVTFEGLVNMMSTLGQYWGEFVALPYRSNRC
jgi:CheY-like chemotaxis protein